MNETIIHSAEEMMRLGADFASAANAGDVFGLVGTLGTGKTHWAKGFVRAIDKEAQVTSPTFSIVNEYRGGKTPLFHFDLYRLKTAGELTGLGWDEYLDENGIVICEWADLYPELLPEHTTWLELRHTEHGNRVVSQIGKPGKTAKPH